MRGFQGPVEKNYVLTVESFVERIEVGYDS